MVYLSSNFVIARFISHFFYVSTLLLTFSSCNNVKYYNDFVTVQMINELQGCEENNLHYKVIKIVDGVAPPQLSSDIVLPVLSQSINNRQNNALLFPDFPAPKISIKVKGYYSQKGHRDHSSGCLGSPLFKIEQILEVSKIDSLKTI